MNSRGTTPASTSPRRCKLLIRNCFFDAARLNRRSASLKRLTGYGPVRLSIEFERVFVTVKRVMLAPAVGFGVTAGAHSLAETVIFEIDSPMNFGFCRGIVVRAVTVALLGASAPAIMAQSNGIFADFTTSLGSFTCQLDYTNAPRTSANFIGLATGQRAWLDLPSGRAKTNAFYNGLTFHRVIAGFMNQGGSPNGLGTDGPGYVFKDEFSPLLVFDSFGVLAMANSGPNSDGAQFFITVAPYTYGNNTYTIFGRLVSGSNVVYAINHVATDASDKPLTNVVIQQVNIRRVGTAAQAFDINGQGLPIVTNLPLRIAKGAGQVTLTFSNRLYGDNRLYSSTNLTTWTSDSLGVEITPPSSNSVQRTNDSPRKFFRFAQIQYPSSTFAPKTMYGRTLALNFDGGNGVITIVFDSVGGGTYTWSLNTPGIVSSYNWIQDVYRGQLWPIYFSGVPPMTLQLNFSSASAGSFSGTAYSTGQISVSGTFTVTGP
jgi:cyclophilin family peptidyl-prolyl cis-trans isomerase